ncbi:hypothetical protein NDU88_003972 [Pleurodeles waltl]|uniref:Uncharacterized protein n=1 Tax=Pleurodeles waltl TaxID=8319 RepID=A0AAV7RGR2_PLEWA|nr:hypothetical protein NDU88_003972 [Pleurodeles waltl]
MVRHRWTDASQGNTMEQYTTPVPLPQHLARWEGSGDGFSVLANLKESSHAELLVAIRGSRVALEGKIETVTVEVNLLWVDLRQVSDKVKVAKGSIAELQAEDGTKAVVSAGLAGGLNVELERGAEGLNTGLTMSLMIQDGCCALGCWASVLT